jgi:hypothetical protein
MSAVRNVLDHGCDTKIKRVLPALPGQLSRQVEPLLGVNLSRREATGACHGLSRFQPVRISNHLEGGVPQLARGQVDKSHRIAAS